MNTVKKVVTRWLSTSVASVLEYLSVLLMTGTAEELAELHVALDAGFTVIQPIQYTARFRTHGIRFLCNSFCNGLNGGPDISRSNRFGSVAEVKAELRSRAEPAFGYSDLCIVEIQGDKVLRVVEPATLGEPKKFAVAWIYNGGGRFFSAIGHHYKNRIGYGNAAVENALTFATLVDARAHGLETTEDGTGSTFADVRLCVFDVTDRNNPIEIEEVVRVKPLAYVVRYSYNTVGFPKDCLFLGESIGNGTSELSDARRFKSPSNAMQNIKFSYGANDDVQVIEIVEVRGDDIVRVVA